MIQKIFHSGYANEALYFLRMNHRFSFFHTFFDSFLKTINMCDFLLLSILIENQIASMCHYKNKANGISN